MRARVNYELAVRLAERSRALKRRRRLYVGSVLGAIVLVALIAGLAFFSPLLQYRPSAAVVEGASKEVPSAQVVQATEPFKGVPLPRLDTGAMAKAIARSNIRIANVQVHRSPLHGVKLQLKLRTPIGIERSGDDAKLVDSKGIAFAPAGEQNLKEISLPAGADRAATASAVAKIIPAVPTQIMDRVTKIDGANADRISLVLDSGATIIWGDESNNELKAKVIAVLAQRNASTYDLTDPARPVTS